MARRVRYQPRPSYRPNYRAPQRQSRAWRPPEFKPWQWRLIFAAIVILLIWAWLAHAFAVTTITVEPGVRQADVGSALRQAMSGHPGQGNLLSLDAGRLTHDLLKLDASLSQATITRKWPHGLNVTVAEKVATIGWQSAGQTYILDRDGVIIGQSNSNGHLLVVQDDSNLPVTVGKRVATAGFVTFCQQLSEQIPNTGLQLTKLEIHDTTFDLYTTTNKGYQLIWDTQRTAGEEITDLQSTLKALSAQHKTPGSYIDLRIAGRAYYK
jgi:cell division septal protein FtsQ